MSILHCPPEIRKAFRAANAKRTNAPLVSDSYPSAGSVRIDALLDGLGRRRDGEAGLTRLAQGLRQGPADLVHRGDDLIDGDNALDAGERHIGGRHGDDGRKAIALDAGDLNETGDGIADEA